MLPPVRWSGTHISQSQKPATQAPKPASLPSPRSKSTVAKLESMLLQCLFRATKKPREKQRGSSLHPFSRRVSADNWLGYVPDFRLPIYRHADHSGGTVADFHGLPTSPVPVQLSKASLSRASVRVNPGKGWRDPSSGSSTSGRASRRERVNLPANLPARRARSRKPSSNCGRHRAAAIRGCP